MLTAQNNRIGSGGASPAHSPGPRRAFTLIELLVVISIIAVLVSILLPSLAAAREFTRFTLCQQRLKSWGNAFAIYTTVYDGYFPHMDGLDRSNSPEDQCGWVDVLPPMIGERPWRDHGIYDWPGFGTFFQCPSAELAGGYGYDPIREGFFSYAMNSCLALDPYCYRPYGAPASWKPMPSFLNTARIDKPARVVLLFDQLLDPSAGYGGATRNRSAGKHCGAYPKDFAVRHAMMGKGKGGSILYCDYSVRWQETVWQPDWPTDMNCPPADDENWYPYLTP